MIFSSPLNINNAVIVTDGNSITGSATYPNDAPLWPTQLLQKSVITGSGVQLSNVAVGGQTTAQMIERFPQFVKPLLSIGRTNILIAWEIRNSIYFGASVSDACSTFHTYCSMARSVGWKVVIISILPCNQPTIFGDTGAQFQVKIDAANVWLRKNWQTCGNVFIDAAILPSLSTINSNYPDGVHPTHRSLGVLVDILEVSIQKIGR